MCIFISHWKDRFLNIKKLTLIKLLCVSDHKGLMAPQGLSQHWGGPAANPHTSPVLSGLFRLCVPTDGTSPPGKCERAAPSSGWICRIAVGEPDACLSVDPYLCLLLFFSFLGDFRVLFSVLKMRSFSCHLCCVLAKPLESAKSYPLVLEGVGEGYFLCGGSFPVSSQVFCSFQNSSYLNTGPSGLFLQFSNLFTLIFHVVVFFSFLGEFFHFLLHLPFIPQSWFTSHKVFCCVLSFCVLGAGCFVWLATPVLNSFLFLLCRFIIFLNSEFIKYGFSFTHFLQLCIFCFSVSPFCFLLHFYVRCFFRCLGALLYLRTRC